MSYALTHTHSPCQSCQPSHTDNKEEDAQGNVNILFWHKLEEDVQAKQSHACINGIKHGISCRYVVLGCLSFALQIKATQTMFIGYVKYVFMCNIHQMKDTYNSTYTYVCNIIGTVIYVHMYVQCFDIIH